MHLSRSAQVPLQAFLAVRGQTRALCEPLEPSDCEGQSMPCASPVKWHLAHTTWFFEQFVLRAFEPNFVPFHPQFRFLFNSYYDGVGPRHTRAERGLLSRPTLPEVWSYRGQVEERVARLLEQGEPRVQQLVEVGCHHEQQHQELLLTDLKHLFSRNALNPVYSPRASGSGGADSPPLEFSSVSGGLVDVGARDDGFAFDNERPRHRVYLEPFRFADRLVTNAEFEQFIVDDGYSRPELWLDEGFAAARARGWSCPLYWRGAPGEYREFTLHGECDLSAHEPVCHVSYYEADAFARWSGARLCREEEWELLASGLPVEGNLLDTCSFHPRPVAAAASARPAQCYGDVWEWSASAYLPYPRFKPAEGTLGEYNGKFMSGQMVLRGGSCATPSGHIRSSYRNFFHPDDRWQFSGIRLAADA
jgi:ergothioneine biosynthesis protein EgtB